MIYILILKDFWFLWDISTSFVKLEKHTVRSDTFCFNALCDFFSFLFLSIALFIVFFSFFEGFLARIVSFSIRKRKHMTRCFSMSAVKNVCSSVLPVVCQYTIVILVTLTQSISCVRWDSSKGLSSFSCV